MQLRGCVHAFWEFWNDVGWGFVESVVFGLEIRIYSGISENIYKNYKSEKQNNKI